MSWIRYEVTANRVRFVIRESKPDGVTDNDWSVEISLQKTVEFPVVPALSALAVDHRYRGIQAFWVPRLGMWIAFIWYSWSERGAGPNEDKCEGPYQWLRSPPQESNVIAAERLGQLVES